MAKLSYIESNWQSLIETENSKSLTDFLSFIDEALGLKLSERKDISEEQKITINNRNEARQNQDWTKSDELRNELLEQGIGLRDISNRSIWFRL